MSETRITSLLEKSFGTENATDLETIVENEMNGEGVALTNLPPIPRCAKKVKRNLKIGIKWVNHHRNVQILPFKPISWEISTYVPGRLNYFIGTSRLRDGCYIYQGYEMMSLLILCT